MPNNFCHHYQLETSLAGTSSSLTAQHILFHLRHPLPSHLLNAAYQHLQAMHTCIYMYVCVHVYVCVYILYVRVCLPGYTTDNGGG